ncbi:hypothetical protein JKP88DRAFT_287913 [Tribonema minus]|uniref:Uncharacterized protein n=1 Tax=Tribonema minus TaxID=303371 RepID=A0A835Z783_9STRA|nr:hypothetical protein JKP88DRAFT_287913 [Tribonema minus]
MHAELGDALSAVTLLAESLKEVPGLGIPAQPQNVYVPPDQVDNFPQIVAGSAAGVLVYLWALYEFGSRIVTQRACAVCNGSGLVTVSRTGRKLMQPRKCYACGGFLPWESWSRFWVANKYVGNGGILRRPAADYDELNAKAREAQAKQAAADQEPGAADADAQ